jgi:predicted methyltransferase
MAIWRLLAMLAATAAASVQAGAQSLIDSAVSDSARSETYRKLDADRKPAEVLQFAGLRPGMRVLDVGTGGGYYTEILAYVVGPTGAVIGWNGPAFAARPNVRQALARIRNRYGNVTYYATPTTTMALPAESFDLVLLHLMFHDFYWESAEFGFARVDPADVARALYTATKPGGALVIADHVATGARPPREEVDATHRIDPRVARRQLEAAGFVFEAESPILSRPDDDHTKRVFNPAIRGKTDRFLFRFRRPPARGAI